MLCFRSSHNDTLRLRLLAILDRSLSGSACSRTAVPRYYSVPHAWLCRGIHSQRPTDSADSIRTAVAYSQMNRHARRLRMRMRIRTE